MKALFIAEKPSVARDVQKVYSKMNYPDKIEFAAFVGHVCGLAMPEEYDDKWGKPWKPDVLPMVPDEFKIKVLESSKDVYESIAKKIKSGNYDYIICGTDAGREGELIFRLFYEREKIKLPVKRFWASDTTEATVKKALLELRDGDSDFVQNLEKTARYRAYFDWLLGLNLTRAVTLQSKTYIPVGRVMTPTLSIVVKRELAIRNFVPENFWEIEGVFDNYAGIWINKETKERRLTKEEDAKAVLSRIEGAKTGVVESLETKRQTSKAPALHSLIELQKEASKLYGYTAKEVLDIAQALYEKHKLLTYPRTSSRFLPKSIGAIIQKHIEPIRFVPELSNYANNILADPAFIQSVMAKKDYVDDSKVTDHHAILVTDTVPNFSVLSEKETNIYMLVARRVISLFLPPLEIDITTMITEVNGEHFISKGQVIINEGYSVLYPKKKSKEDEDDKMLPKLAKGDTVSVSQINVLTKKTTPPKRFNEADLLSAMFNAGSLLEDSELKSIMKETEGLGTEATRADIIEKLIKVEMMERQKKLLVPTEFGISVIEQLGDLDIVSPSLTATWETKLRDVGLGKYAAQDFYKEMVEYIEKNTADVLNTMKPMENFVKESKQSNSAPKEKESLGECPKCKANVIEGKTYFLCEKYKNPCNFISGKEFFGAKITKTDMKAILKGKETKPKKLTYTSGKTNESTLKLSKDGKVIASWMEK